VPEGLPFSHYASHYAPPAHPAAVLMAGGLLKPSKPSVREAIPHRAPLHGTDWLGRRGHGLSLALSSGMDACGISPRERPEPEPFEIHVPRRAIDDLQLRLRKTRWAQLGAGAGAGTGPIGESDWGRGTSPVYLRDLIAYWRDAYSWDAAAAKLNMYPQFVARVDGVGVHFVHALGGGGGGERPLPLLLLHGWPDSFYRFHKVIPILTRPAVSRFGANDSFDVVVPSLPGFAFTGAVPPSGEPVNRQSARLLWRLMTEVLGYRRFLVAGGDGGSVIAQILAMEHPESVLGIHLTDIGWHATQIDPATVSGAERKYIEDTRKRFMNDGAYALVQMSQPRSLAAALNDSPVGLASWIADRFHAWTDPDVADGLTPDDLLTNVMIYWATQTIGSSMYSYYAEAERPSLTPRDRVDVPVAVALFPKDGAGHVPRSFAERTLRVVRWTEMAEGGHFAALEVPERYAHDLIEFCRPFRAAPAPSPRTNHVDPSV
jgi:pimeloyl-ACP methyl ester carboxylesterase